MPVERRKLLSGGNALMAVLAVLGVLVILNVISDRRFKRWDWTGSQIYSLSDKTTKILTGLDAEVAATVLLQPDDPVYDEVHELLANYQAKSQHVKVEYLDPSRQPARVEEIIKTFGLGRGDHTAIVFSSGSRHRHITLEELVEVDMSTAEMGMSAPRIKAFKGEAAFTSAILSVSQERQRTACFLKGHGEVAVDDGAPGGISRFAEALRRQNLKVESAEMKTGIPSGCELLVIAGPTIGFAPSEADALGAYVDGGGRLLALIDPVLSREGGMQELGIERMLIVRGVAIGNDIVLDPSRLLTFGSAESFGVSDFPSHIVTKDLAGSFVVISLARSVAPVTPAPNGWSVTSLMRTSAEGWAERDLKDLGGAVSKGADDGAGPVSIGVAAEKKAPAAGGKDARMFVIGNSRVAHNQFIGAGAGLDLLLNASGFLLGQEEQIGIAPREPEQVRLQMSPNQERSVALFTLFGMPGLAIAAGVVVWLFRRR